MKKHFVLPLAMLAMCVLPVVAQSGPGGEDTLSALLVEVRALRVAVERAASSSPQIQLLTARLTVQNDRLSRAMRDADTARQELEGMLAEITRFTSQAAQLEEAAERETDQVKVRQLKAEQQGIKNMLEERSAQETRLRARESELANLVTAEQGQWAELNRRFDELERELRSRRPQ
jgi:predicted  nucleic acid-binding Zn-ribbon protein